jgi:tripartite-type tricarboxylate transporter receptor subunit TctC
MTHLMGELMNVKLGMNTVHVPYKGSAEFKGQIAKDDALMRDVIKKANIRID